jgi:hypothetical protein
VGDDNVPTRNLASYDRAAFVAVTKNQSQKIWALTVTNRGSTWSSFRQAEMLPDANDSPCAAGSLDEELQHATKELIRSDSDDPAREETVSEMMRARVTEI